MSILDYSVAVFLTQLIFIGSRTWNVRAIAKNDMAAVLLSGAVVHLSWLVSIAIGAYSMTEIMNNFELKYIPIVICSLVGGLVGSVIGMKNKKSK